MLDKHKTAKAFSRAAAEYSRYAKWQTTVARQLLELTPDRFNTALDLGCGTGEMAFLLQSRYKSAEIHGIDIAEGMISLAQERSIVENSLNIEFRLGDMEHIPYPDESFDLVVSNLSLQWLSDPQNSFKEVYRVLRPSGKFCFSTILEGSLAELNKVYTKVTDHQTGHPWQTSQAIQIKLQAAKFLVHYQEQKSDTLYFSDFTSLTDSIRGIGARSQTTNFLGKTKLTQLIKQYPQTKQGLPLTYQVYLVDATALKIS